MVGTALSDRDIDRAILQHELDRRERIRKWRDETKDNPGQRPPDGKWRVWYIRGGRGGGKTWAGGRMLSEWIQRWPGKHWAVVAPSYGDARDKCIEGPSGLLAAFGTSRGAVDAGRSALIKSWNRSLGELRFRDGGAVWVDGADDGAKSIQGFDLAGGWADEVGLWDRWEMAWKESLQFAIRHDPALIVATGTPKRGHPLVKELMTRDDVAKTLVRTADNIKNLSEAFVNELQDRYGGTTIGRQELEGEFFEESAGALWSRDLIQYRSAPRYSRVVVAIDPAATSGVSADETGIVGAGRDGVGLGYVLEDASLRGTPDEWGRAAVRLYHRLEADIVVAESNNGGEMVQHVIRSVDPNVHVKLVHASRGKMVRAEPVAAKYEQNRIFHAQPLPDLEDQMVTWSPKHDAADEKSPDRVDALVWAMTELMVTSAWSGGHGGIV